MVLPFLFLPPFLFSAASWRGVSHFVFFPGDLCSFAGPEALPLDRLARTLGFARLGKEDAEMADLSSPEITLVVQYLKGAWCRVLSLFTQALSTLLPTRAQASTAS